MILLLESAAEWCDGGGGWGWGWGGDAEPVGAGDAGDAGAAVRGRAGGLAVVRAQVDAAVQVPAGGGVDVAQRLRRRDPRAGRLAPPQAWRGVRGHVHPHLLRDGGADREPEVRRRDLAVRERGVRGPGGDDDHPFDGPHLRRAPEPVPDHRLRGVPPLPLAPGPGLRDGPGAGLHLRRVRAQGRLPPVPLRRGHRPRRRHLHRPGLLHRVHHHLQPPLRRHRRRHRHPRGGRARRDRGGSRRDAQHPRGRADDGRVDEPGEDAGAGGGGGELQAAVDIPGGADAGRGVRRRRVQAGQAQGRQRRDAAPAAQLPTLIDVRACSGACMSGWLLMIYATIDRAAATRHVRTYYVGTAVRSVTYYYYFHVSVPRAHRDRYNMCVP